MMHLQPTSTTRFPFSVFQPEVLARVGWRFSLATVFPLYSVRYEDFYRRSLHQYLKRVLEG